VAVLVATMAVGSCASRHDARVGAREAEERKALAGREGCTTCHGTTSEGGLGPSWIRLSGSTVQLADGSTVTADDSYIAESIQTRSAKKVAGYSLTMPPTQLTDDEVAALVAYIHSLGAAAKN
jgi:cytochrome c oxidase subunit 2